MELNTLILTVYLLSVVTFILGFKLSVNPASAQKGNTISAIGMGAAIVVTLMSAQIQRYDYILAGLVLGTVIGYLLSSRAPLSKLPQITGLLNGFGGLAGWLVAWAEFHAHPAGQSVFGGVILWLTSVFGCIAFAGSATVWLKMQKRNIAKKPVFFTGQSYLTRIVLGGILATGALFFFDMVAPEAYLYFALFSALSLFFGVLHVLPNDGADIPLAVCLLNAYTGLSACASGFIFQNPLLIATGALVAAAAMRLMRILGEETGRPPIHVLWAGLRGQKGEASDES